MTFSLGNNIDNDISVGKYSQIKLSKKGNPILTISLAKMKRIKNISMTEKDCPI